MQLVQDFCARNKQYAEKYQQVKENISHYQNEQKMQQNRINEQEDEITELSAYLDQIN